MRALYNSKNDLRKRMEQFSYFRDEQIETQKS